MMDMRREIIRRLLPQILLGLLCNEPKHGYALMCEISKKYQVNLSASTVYPALLRLEKDELVTSQAVIVNKRIRTIYSITSKGLKTLNWYQIEIQIIAQPKKEVVEFIEVKPFA